MGVHNVSCVTNKKVDFRIGDEDLLYYNFLGGLGWPTHLEPK